MKVIAIAAVKQVIALIAGQGVIPRAAINGVVAGTAIKNVVARKPVDIVVTATTIEDVGKDVANGAKLVEPDQRVIKGPPDNAVQVLQQFALRMAITGCPCVLIDRN